ncbi:TPA: hypothetical protein ACH3X2_012309 [Trebouxia sp. C0005]
MERWGLTCFCITDQDGAGNEVVAGAANTEVCSSCTNSGLPSLCCHRSNAKAAALCVFDTRAGLAMVQRYSIHHRSLYPIMTCARGHYLFTSHVGAPLAVWDKRQMSHAVYEEEYLGNFPKTETFANAEVPLPLPDRAADHQGLYLSTDGDQLLGRADNGMMWLWDLSSCLGWQKGGPTGLWMQDNQVRQLAAQQTHSDALQPNDALPYQAGFQQRWPDMLGSLPYWDGLPKVCLRNGGTCPIIATSSKSLAERPSGSADLEQYNEYIACLSLRPTAC